MAGSNSTYRGVPRIVTEGGAGVIPVIGASQIPQIQYSSGSARALQQFSRDLFSLSNEFEDQLDQRAEAESLTQGAVAGATGNFELQDYGTIRGRAFNKAAIESFTATLDTQSIVKLNELQQKYWNDPAKLQSEIAAYQKGVSEELGKMDPAAAVSYNNRMTVRGMPAIEAARDTVYKLTRDEAQARIIENEVALRAEIKSQAANLFSENPDLSRAAGKAIGMVQADYMAVYEAVDPTTGKPLYSPSEVAKAKRDFYDLTMKEASLSWFDSQTDKAGAYLKFSQGDFEMRLNNVGGTAKVIHANQGKTRNDPIQTNLQQQLSAAASALGEGIDVMVSSGGQETRAEILERRRQGDKSGGRTGSNRHDHGGAGDVVLMVNGQPVTPAQDRDLYLRFAENAAAAGITGIGISDKYIHLGGGSKAAWGYGPEGGRGKYLPPDFKEAIDRGWAGEKIESKPSSVPVKVRDALPAATLDAIETEMRQRIVFGNQLADRQASIEAAQVVARQKRNGFEMTNRLYSAGTTDPATGKAIAPLTREEITEAVRTGALDAPSGEAIVKAMATERPQRSDQATYRDFLGRIYAGEDVYGMILSAGDKLSNEDAAELLSKNQSVVRGNAGEFSKEQAFQFELLKSQLTPDGLMAGMDQGRQDRRVLALDEYRRRVLDPENVDPPSIIAREIADRAKLEANTMDMSKLGSMIKPRFFVPAQTGGNRIDVKQSAIALSRARTENRITEAQFIREIENLKTWDTLQKQIEQDQPKAKP